MGLGRLLCGESSTPCVANTTLDHLSSSIDRFAGQATRILNGPFTEESQIFGAFCARVVLENSCAALVGRLDPFRLIYLAEFQNQDGFEYGKQSNSGFKWSGDVVPDKQPTNLWSSEHDISKVSRALFSTYAEHAYWKPSIELALDAINSANEAGFSDILSLDPENYIPETRGRSISLYSKLSKGVHWEFFSSSVVLDEGTIKDAVRDTLLTLSAMGLISHFIPTAYRKLNNTDAMAAYLEFRGSFA